MKLRQADHSISKTFLQPGNLDLVRRPFGDQLRDLLVKPAMLDLQRGKLLRCGLVVVHAGKISHSRADWKNQRLARDSPLQGVAGP